MHGSRIVVIDDEPHIRRVVRNALQAAGADVLEAATGATGIDLTASSHPALVVLDLGLPDMSGLSVCNEIRRWSTVPIIVLSARHAEKEKIALLNAGADDYVAKPFSTNELEARVRAQIRRGRLSAGNAETTVIAVAGLQIDLARRTVQRNGSEIHLTPTEWDLLRALVKHAGRTLTHHQIFREVWHNAAGDAQAYLRVHVANLRRKIEPDAVRPTLILTEPGVGYRFRSLD